MRLRVRPVRTPGRYRQDRRTFRSTPHTPDRPRTGHRHSDTALRSERAAEKKRRGSHKQPLWNRSRKIPIPGQPAERPEHSAEGDRNAGFTHVRTYAVASISLGTTGPAAVPVQNPERPERGGDYARRRNETEKGKRPDRSRERTALEEYDEYEQKRSPASLQGSLRRRLPTLPHVTAVPSALVGLTSLFGMGRGGTPLL